MKFIRFLSLPLVALLSASPAFADEAQTLASKVQKVYNKAPSYTADFEQETTSPLARKPMNASGKLAFKKPGKVRFQYDKPQENLLVSNGKKLWFYEKEAKQVVITNPEKKIADKAFVFLGGSGDIREEFHVSMGKTPTPVEGAVLQLKPKKPDATFHEILLVVDPKTGVVNETWIKTATHQTLRYRFTNASTKRKLDDSAFTFEVPKGVDVIDEMNTPLLKMQ